MAAYGHCTGSGTIRNYPVSNTAAIAEGDILKIETATVGGVSNVGCVTPAGAGDLPIGVAAAKCDAPTTDGDYTVPVYIDSSDIFYYPVDTSTITGAYRFKLCDVGGAQSINFDATSDNVVEIWDVDTVNNAAYVRFKFTSQLS